MFSLVHYYVNKKIFGSVPPLMALGALWPDMAIGAGCNRNLAHEMGYDFYLWQQQYAPGKAGHDLALGVISHGITPPCVDDYSDVHWPGYCRGWCFMQGEKYLDQVRQATKLPDSKLWWKSHNFVEICGELLIDAEHPELKVELTAAISDASACAQAGEMLGAYHDLPPNSIAAVFPRVPSIFAIQNPSPAAMAQKQIKTFEKRLHHYDANLEQMTALLIKMLDDLREPYAEFFAVLERECGAMLRRF